MAIPRRGLSPLRYVRALALFWSSSVQAEMEYRTNFVVAALTSVGTMIGALFGIGLFYQGGHTLGGWSWHQALVVAGLYTFLDGVESTLFSKSHVRITEYIREGTLDFVLMKPIDSQFLVSIREVSLWGLPNVFLGAGLVLFGLAQVDTGSGSLAYGLLPIALAVVILYSVGFLLATLTIWFVKLWNLTIALQSVLEAGKLPVQAYPRRYRWVFTFVIPIAFLTTVPAEAAMGMASRGWLLAEAAVAASLFVGTRAFWKFALRFYTSASS